MRAVAASFLSCDERQDRPDASGLGMFISYSIVRDHGGEMTVDSRLGEGFKVHIVLPAAA